MLKINNTILGTKFGRLTPVKQVGLDSRGSALWECLCDCGCTKIVKGYRLLNGNTRSCGCLKRDKIPPMYVDLVGKIFGRLVVIKRSHKNKSGNYTWECLCECGNMVVVSGGSLNNGHTRSCGCLKARNISAAHLIDITGKKFGKLTVIRKYGKNLRGLILWLCVCECGQESISIGVELRNGHKKSCGCSQHGSKENNSNWKGGDYVRIK